MKYKFLNLKINIRHKLNGTSSRIDLFHTSFKQKVHCTEKKLYSSKLSNRSTGLDAPREHLNTKYVSDASPVGVRLQFFGGQFSVSVGINRNKPGTNTIKVILAATDGVA